MAVVVVLPCVPAIASGCCPAVSCSRKSSRLSTGDTGCPRGLDLNIVIGDGRRAHYQLRSGDVFRPVSSKNGHARLLQALRNWRCLAIRAADDVAPFHKTVAIADNPLPPIPMKCTCFSIQSVYKKNIIAKMKATTTKIKMVVG